MWCGLKIHSLDEACLRHVGIAPEVRSVLCLKGLKGYRSCRSNTERGTVVVGPLSTEHFFQNQIQKIRSKFWSPTRPTSFQLFGKNFKLLGGRKPQFRASLDRAFWIPTFWKFGKKRASFKTTPKPRDRDMQETCRDRRQRCLCACALSNYRCCKRRFRQNKHLG